MKRKLSVLTLALAILPSACGQKKDLNVMSDQRMVLTAFLTWRANHLKQTFWDII